MKVFRRTDGHTMRVSLHDCGRNEFIKEYRIDLPLSETREANGNALTISRICRARTGGFTTSGVPRSELYFQ